MSLSSKYSPFIQRYAKGYIQDFTEALPAKLTRKEVKKCRREIECLSLVSSEYKNQFEQILSTLKRVDALLNKYHRYQDDYEWALKRGGEIGGNPLLYDALLTGCLYPLCKSSFDCYNKKIESDIKEIVQLIPQSMNCVIGRNRMLKGVSPLYTACMNNTIPIHIIEFLLKNGARFSDKNKNAEPIQLTIDFNKWEETERLSKIVELAHRHLGLTHEDFNP